VEHQKKGKFFKPFFLEIKYRNVKTLNINTAHKLLSKRYRYDHTRTYLKNTMSFFITLKSKKNLIHLLRLSLLINACKILFIKTFHINVMLIFWRSHDELLEYKK
jgi:hypothetical protein